MVNKVTDISSNNPSSNEYIKQLYQNGSRFNFVKLTQGDWYVSPSASQQILNTLKTFNNYVGIYHFVEAQSSIENQARYFVHWLKQYGFDSTTQVMLDVEDTQLTNVTSKINQFNDILAENGYTRLWTYFMDSWASEGKIEPQSIHKAHIWIASYGAHPKHKMSVWQYQGLGTQDWEYDYSGILDCNKKVKVKPHYLTTGHKFKVISQRGLYGYRDKAFNHPHGVLLGRGSIIYGQVVKTNDKTRIKTNIGFFSSRSDLIQSIE